MEENQEAKIDAIFQLVFSAQKKKQLSSLSVAIHIGRDEN
jgi:hypothetical protein